MDWRLLRNCVCIELFLDLTNSTILTERRATVAQSAKRRATEWMAGVRLPTGAKPFSSPKRPDRFSGPPSLLYNGCMGVKGPEHEADRLPVSTSKVKTVELNLHSPPRLHGAVSKKLSMETALLFCQENV
jgi:hypothetical protein